MYEISPEDEKCRNCSQRVDLNLFIAICGEERDPKTCPGAQ